MLNKMQIRNERLTAGRGLVRDGSSMGGGGTDMEGRGTLLLRGSSAAFFKMEPKRRKLQMLH